MTKYVVTLPAAPSAGKAEQFQAKVAEHLGVPAADVLVLVGATSFAAVEVAAARPVVRSAVTANLPLPKE